MAFVHARTFETRWGLALAFIDLDDEDTEVLRLQLWAPIGEDGSDAKVAMKIGLNAEASDDAHDRMSEANRSALVAMDAARFEAAIEAAGAAAILDQAFARQTPDTAEGKG